LWAAGRSDKHDIWQKQHGTATVLNAKFSTDWQRCVGTGAPKFRISGDTQSCRRFCSDSAVRFLVFQHHAAAQSTALSALTVGWTAGVKTEWWGTGVVICLERGADLHMAQLMPLPLTISLLQ